MIIKHIILKLYKCNNETKNRMTLKDAHDYVKRRRPIIRPNTSFWRQLIDYEYSLLRHNTVEMRMSPVGEVPDLYYNQVKDLCFVR